MKHLCLLLAAVAACALCAQDTKSTVDWETASAGPAKIAVPKGWRTFDGLQPTMPIFRQGDGMGVSTVDETGAPVQIGLTVERFPPATEGTEAIAKEIALGASRNPNLKPVGNETVEALELSDRTKATLITTEFIKASTRHSFYLKLVAKSDSGDVWVATGYIVAGRNSSWPTAKSSLAAWLRAHVISLTVAGKEIDRKALERAYIAADEGHDRPPSDPGAPNFNLTGKWSGAWQDGGSTEAFTMELLQTGATVKGTAIFMDSARTKAAVSGEATGPKIRLVMTPTQPSLPKTVWVGTVSGQAITGNWSLNSQGSTATGTWSATTETNVAKLFTKD